LRPISLLETTRKIFEGIMLKIIELNTQISAHQMGFLRNKNTIHQIANLDGYMRLMKCKNMTVMFLDIKKAYDSVDKKILWGKYFKKQNNMTTPYLNIIKKLFDFNTTCLISNNEIRAEKMVRKGIMQGSKLSPILFKNRLMILQK
jgi:hypothetical protein